MDWGAVTQDQLARATAERHGLDHLDLTAFEVDMAAANLLELHWHEMIYDFVLGSCLIMIVKGSTSLRPRSAGSPKTRCRFKGPTPSR